MPECDNCGRHVSTDYARVKATRNGHIPGCPDCNAQDNDTGHVRGTRYTQRQLARESAR